MSRGADGRGAAPPGTGPYARLAELAGRKTMGLFRKILAAWSGGRRRRAVPRPGCRHPPARCRPALEELESRLCPSTLSYSSGTIYLTGAGSTTLSDIHRALPQAPLAEVDPANH